MKDLVLLSGIIGVLADIPLIVGILRNKVKQNCVTYILWGLLDFIVFFTIILQGGNNFWLPLGYAIGAFVIALLLVYKKQVSWSSIETMAVVLVGISVFFWFYLGDRAGNIVSVLALGIASIPQIVSTAKDPKTTPTGIWTVFALAGILSFIGGESWTVEDKLYPAVVMTFSLLITILSTRKK